MKPPTPVCYLNPPAEETSIPPPSRASCPGFKGQSELMREQKVIGGRRRPLEARLCSPDCMGICNCSCNSGDQWSESQNQNQTGRKWEGGSSCSCFLTRVLGKDEGQVKEGGVAEVRGCGGGGGRREKRCFNLLIPSLPIRPCIKQITQNAPLHTSHSLPASPYPETLGK